MSGERFMTRDHETIRRWVEERGGKPSTVASTRTGDDPGLIRLDFPGYSGEGSLEEISWEEWFRKFDENDLVLLYQETLQDGGESNFNKLISRETAEQNDSAEWVDGGGGRRTRSSQKSGSEAFSGAKKRASEGTGAGGGREKVNLNRASAEELHRVFGIGPATASKIVAYREDELGGEFHSLHDITHIDGVGEKTARLIMEKATLD